MVTVLAHGAGAPSSSDWMRATRRRLARIGPVVGFDYPYMRSGRRRPDRMPTLLRAHRVAWARARRRHGEPVFLAGKSMGSRVGCHLALAVDVAGLVCFGYPLVSQSGKLRDEVLCALRTPILFLQGTRDPLCPLDRLAEVRRRMRAPSTLHVVDGGDHSLRVGTRALDAAGRTQDDVDDALLDVVRAFYAKIIRA